MPVEVHRLRRARRHDLDRGVPGDARGEVHETAVELRGERVLGEARPDPLRDFAEGRPGGDLAGRAVGQRDRHHLA